MASYHRFGTESEEVLSYCMTPLERVVRRALQICRIDFSCVESIRSVEQQRKNIIDEVSWTMNSKHLDWDGDGKVAAVDIYPWVAGKTSHNPEHYKLIAKAMFQAAFELGITIRWGGLWEGGEPFKDAPHWELA